MEKTLTGKAMFIYCLGDFARAIFNGLTATYLMYIFLPQANSALPLLLPYGALSFAIVRFIGVIFDAVIDPLIASKSDNSKHPLGARIPFMRYSAIPMGLFAVLMIYVPIGHESWINVAWLFVNLLLFNLFSSLFLVPFYGLMAELVTDTKRRVYFFTINTLLFVIGSAVIYVTPIIKNALVSAGYPELTAWRSAFLVFGVLGAASAFVSSFSIKESDYVKRTPSYVPLWESLKATFRYKDFTILVVGYMFMWIAFSFFNSSLMYYVTMLLGLKDNFAVVVMAIAIVVGISTYPLVNSLAKKIGKKPLLIGACISYIVIYTGIFFYQFFVGMVGNAVTGILIGALIGFPISITNIIPLAAFADLAQYDTIKTGRYQSGMFVGSRNLLQQLAQAIALLIVPLTITGSVLEGNANIAGVRMTTLIAAGTIAVAFAFYLFYNDKKITKTIDDYNALHVGDEQV
jgi:GPH family glycoside/pentoside/hexuronide:cation symporter